MRFSILKIEAVLKRLFVSPSFSLSLFSFHPCPSRKTDVTPPTSTRSSQRCPLTWPPPTSSSSWTWTRTSSRASPTPTRSLSSRCSPCWSAHAIFPTGDYVCMCVCMSVLRWLWPHSAALWDWLEPSGRAHGVPVSSAGCVFFPVLQLKRLPPCVLGLSAGPGAFSHYLSHLLLSGLHWIQSWTKLVLPGLNIQFLRWPLWGGSAQKRSDLIASLHIYHVFLFSVFLYFFSANIFL